MWESNTRLSLSHINLSKLVNLLTSAPFFHSLHFVKLGLLLISPLNSLPARTSRFKLANRSYDHSAPVLWNNLPCWFKKNISTSCSYDRQQIIELLPVLILPLPYLGTNSSMALQYVIITYAFCWRGGAYEQQQLMTCTYCKIGRHYEYVLYLQNWTEHVLIEQLLKSYMLIGCINNDRRI